MKCTFTFRPRRCAAGTDDSRGTKPNPRSTTSAGGASGACREADCTHRSRPARVAQRNRNWNGHRDATRS